jgi:hypothetical protein
MSEMQRTLLIEATRKISELQDANARLTEQNKQLKEALREAQQIAKDLSEQI